MQTITRTVTVHAALALVAALALSWLGCASDPVVEDEAETQEDAEFFSEARERDSAATDEEHEHDEASDNDDETSEQEAQPDETAEPAERTEPRITEGNPHVRMVTSHGTIVFELWEDRYPNSVANFITLAEDGFYDGTQVHRIIAGFMFQGGDPTTRDGLVPGRSGTGGPGYRIPDERDEQTVFDRAGLIAYANAGPNTSGSQFFVMFAAAPHLDGGYNLFGEVVEGMDVLETIAQVPVEQNPANPREVSWPTEIVELESVEVLSKRDHDYDVNKVD